MPPRDSEPQWIALTAEPAEGRRSRGSDVEEDFVLRPRSAPQVVDLGIEVMVRRLLACLGICTLLWFPLRAVMPIYTRTITANNSFDFDFGLFAGWMAFLTLSQALIDVLATTAVTLLSYEQLLGRVLGPLDALRLTFRRLPALIGLFLVRFVILSLGAGLLAGLGVLCFPFLFGAAFFFLYFSWKLSVAPSALILEDLGVKRALSRSFDLTQGSFWRWLGVLILTGTLALSFSLGSQGGDNPAVREVVLDSTGVPAGFFDAAFVVLSSLFAGITTAISAIGITAYYLDTRIRREGFDLVMRLERSRRAGAPVEEPAG